MCRTPQPDSHCVGQLILAAQANGHALWVIHPPAGLPSEAASALHELLCQLSTDIGSVLARQPLDASGRPVDAASLLQHHTPSQSSTQAAVAQVLHQALPLVQQYLASKARCLGLGDLALLRSMAVISVPGLQYNNVLLHLGAPLSTPPQPTAALLQLRIFMQSSIAPPSISAGSGSPVLFVEGAGAISSSSTWRSILHEVTALFSEPPGVSFK